MGLGALALWSKGVFASVKCEQAVATLSHLNCPDGEFDPCCVGSAIAREFELAFPDRSKDVNIFDCGQDVGAVVAMARARGVPWDEHTMCKLMWVLSVRWSTRGRAVQQSLCSLWWARWSGSAPARLRPRVCRVGFVVRAFALSLPVKFATVRQCQEDVFHAHHPSPPPSRPGPRRAA